MMHELPFVSVVVPFYNAQATFEACIQSLLSLHYPSEKYEVILVNDCSTDNSTDIANKFAQSHSNIKVISLKKRLGPAVARNEGILQAKGEIIAFTDADCVVHSEWLRSIVKHFDKVEVAGANGKTMPRSSSESILFHTDAPLTPGGFQTCNIAYRRDVLFTVKLFDENFSAPFREDTDLAFRILDKGFQIASEPEAIVFHPLQKGIGKIVKWGLQHRFDALLYKKHPKRTVKLLDIKLGFITGLSLAFYIGTFSFFLLLTSLYLGNLLLQILSGSLIMIEYVIALTKEMYAPSFPPQRAKGIFILVGPVATYFYLIFCEIGRLYGSLYFKKIII